jgi:hypothetical protein
VRLPPRTLCSLRPRQWADVIRAVLVLMAIEIGLRTTRLPVLAGRLGCGLALDGGPALPTGKVLDITDDEWTRLDLAGKLMRHWPFPSTCLRRALLAGHVLRNRKPQLRIGVAKIHGVVTAHAWLDIGGVSLDPIGGSTFELLTVAAPVTGPGR